MLTMLDFQTNTIDQVIDCVLETDKNSIYMLMNSSMKLQNSY